jgi:hypothetical protein
MNYRQILKEAQELNREAADARDEGLEPWAELSRKYYYKWFWGSYLPLNGEPRQKMSDEDINDDGASFNR